MVIGSNRLVIGEQSIGRRKAIDWSPGSRRFARREQLIGRRQQTVGSPRGASEKTLHTEQGPTRIAVPRDRESTFEPKLVPKHVTRVEGLDDKILALYARGLSTRDIQAELAELYGTEISAPLISRVTDGDAGGDRGVAPTGARARVRGGVARRAGGEDALRGHGAEPRGAHGLPRPYARKGRKEVLTWAVVWETNEGAKFWMRVLSELQARGVKDVLIMCCDGLKGFPAVPPSEPSSRRPWCRAASCIRCGTR